MEPFRHAHSAFIDEIGAATIVSQFDLSPQRLHNWRVRGIPHGYRAAVAQLAGLHEKQVPPGFLAPPAKQTDSEPQSAAA